jgi:hypothetical protein
MEQRAYENNSIDIIAITLKSSARLLQSLDEFFKQKSLSKSEQIHFGIKLSLLQTQKEEIYQLISQSVASNTLFARSAA